MRLNRGLADDLSVLVISVDSVSDEVIPSVRNADIAGIADIAVIRRFPNQAMVVGVDARFPSHPGLGVDQKVNILRENSGNVTNDVTPQQVDQIASLRSAYY